MKHSNPHRYRCSSLAFNSVYIHWAWQEHDWRFTSGRWAVSSVPHWCSTIPPLRVLPSLYPLGVFSPPTLLEKPETLANHLHFPPTPYNITPFQSSVVMRISPQFYWDIIDIHHSIKLGVQQNDLIYVYREMTTTVNLVNIHHLIYRINKKQKENKGLMVMRIRDLLWLSCVP